MPLPPHHHQSNRYDPVADAAARWPQWRIECTDLKGMDELIIPAQQRILIDEQVYDADPDFAVAHVVAHLDLHLSPIWLLVTEAEEEAADAMADLRLGRIDWSCGVDEPRRIA